MTQQQFIETIAGYVKKYAPMFDIGVCSPIIAQACLESAYGTSYKAQYNNFFGLKYRKDRVTCNSGVFNDGGSEQNPDGSYSSLSDSTKWYAFENIEMGVLGYFQFINISNYSNLKGVTDPYKYLQNIKEDGYATSLDYVDNVYAVIKKWDLTKYDNVKEELNMGIEIRKDISATSPCNSTGREITVKGSTLHSVGCPQPKPEVFANIWKTSTSACVHAVLGVDPYAIQCLPTFPERKKARRGWHGGKGSKGSVNDTHLSLEMTEPATIKYVGGASWIETGDGSNTKRHVLATYANAVQLFAQWCTEFNLDPLADGVIISHHEGNVRDVASNHGDVEHIWNKFGLTMNQFRQDVKKAMSGQTVDTVPSKPVDNSSDDTSNQSIKSMSGFVTVIYDGDDGLNVRKAPSILSEVDCIVGKGEVFTVVGISADEKWYKLKSGLFITTIPDYVSFKATEEQKHSTAGTGYYRVRKEWGKADTQIGAFKDKNNAVELCKQNSGYKVFDNDGKEIYPLVSETPKSFLFKVTIPDLRIRKGAGTTYDYWKTSNGKAEYTGKNVFTIVDTAEGQGAKLWGLLKSGEKNRDRWIALDEDYGERV